MTEPPQTIEQLVNRAEILAGRTIADINAEYHRRVPENLFHQKGWIGQFFEHVLGATAGSAAEPDFPELGVELKTLPISPQGKPLESTYVSVVPMRSNVDILWDSSAVKRKLSCVLWLPIISEPSSTPEQRRVGHPLLWRPTDQEMDLIRQDWEDTMEKVALGRFGSLNARHGQVMQVRPKAANASATIRVHNEQGESAQTLPRGFYLRPGFTQEIIRQLIY